MKIENYDLSQFLELKYKYDFESYITYDFLGKNGSFSGKSTICFNKKVLTDFLNEIDILELGQHIEISDSDSDAFIRIKKTNVKGHFEVFYQLGGSHQDSFCRLVLNTDNIGISKFHSLL